MADTNWFVEVAKVSGGALVGWLSHVVKDRDRTRKMRKRLYRELGQNFLRLRVGLGYADSMIADGASFDARTAFLPLVSEYYEHAKKEMDIFVDLREGYVLDLFYERGKELNRLIALEEVADDLFLIEAAKLCELIETSFAQGIFAISVAKRTMHKKQFPAFRERVKLHQPAPVRIRTRTE